MNKLISITGASREIVGGPSFTNQSFSELGFGRIYGWCSRRCRYSYGIA